ncbi:MAG: hypothetical protein HN576_06190 [Bacteriovoracaceae bacterium]|mgnify:CR=1 FL=1|jgi:hypothetical protein|nr:hypothetical protein [Bacteriovoracaceae bacterium]
MAIQTVENEAGVKNLRAVKSNPDVENFYRFISENDLRREAKMIFSEIVNHLNPPKKRRKRKAKTKKPTLH